MDTPELNLAANTLMSDMLFQAVAKLRIPPYWLHAPALRFHHTDAQFLASQIVSDASRLLHVISSLLPKIINAVCELIMASLGSMSWHFQKDPNKQKLGVPAKMTASSSYQKNWAI